MITDLWVETNGVSLKINFYATFRPIVGAKTIEVPFSEGLTVRQLVDQVIKSYPALERQLMDDQGVLLGYVHIFINGRDHYYLPAGLDTVLSERDEIDIFPPVGGG
jgi:MoaD family protein